jgi:hypothetical protein
MCIRILDSGLGSEWVRTVRAARAISIDCVCVVYGLVTGQGRLHWGRTEAQAHSLSRCRLVACKGGGVPMFYPHTLFAKSYPGVQSVHVSAGRVITGEETAQGRMTTQCLSVGAGL